VAVHALAQVELDVDGDLAGDHSPHDRQPEADETGTRDREPEGEQRGSVPSLIASTAEPTEQGITTVITIAAQAKTSDQITVRDTAAENRTVAQGPHPHRLYEVK